MSALFEHIAQHGPVEKAAFDQMMACIKEARSTKMELGSPGTVATVSAFPTSSPFGPRKV